MIKRFYKDTRYIGITYKNKDTFGEWRDEINLQSFYGRPYNRFNFDDIVLYTQATWNNYVAQAQDQAKTSSREVVTNNDYLYLVPIWKHSKITS